MKSPFSKIIGSKIIGSKIISSKIIKSVAKISFFRTTALATVLCAMLAGQAMAQSCSYAPADATDIFASASPAVVAIESVNGGNELYGSGFFWDNQGHIVTNVHVLGQDTVVVLAGGQRLKPQLVGMDAASDIAVLKVAASARPMGLGSSQHVRVGEQVFAIGNPYGVGISLSRGIISGMNRSIETTERHHLSNLLQTDAALNPGNSGGPLIDQHGCLIGMNTAILSPSSTSSGVGFAMTVEQLAAAVPNIMAGRPAAGFAAAQPYDAAVQAQPVGYGYPVR